MGIDITVTPIIVDPSSSLPAYRQVAEHIKQEIIVGNLTAGDRLPPVRELAQRIGISRLTVHRAYLSLVDQKVLEARQGSGTFVAPQQAREMSISLLRQFTNRGPIVQFEETARKGQIRSFATHVADLRLLDLRDYYADHIQLANSDPWSLYVPELMGESRLRDISAKWFGLFSAHAKSDHIYIHPGMNGLRIFLKLTTQPGDTILVQDPSHLLAGDFYRASNRNALGIDPSRISPEQLEQAIEEHNIKAAVICPYFGTGTGESWPAALLQSLNTLCEKKRIPVFNILSRALMPYGEMKRLPIPDHPELVWHEIQWRTLTAQAFSTASTLVPPQYYAHIAKTINAHESVTKISQLASANFLKKNMRDHLKKVNSVYCERGKKLHDLLKTYLRDDVQFSRPQGGYGVILRLPKKIDANWLFHRSIDDGVAVMPGDFMCHNPDNFNMVRLSYGLLDTHEIERAAPIACRAINASLDRPSP